jgi:hypothetical protein
LKTTGTAVLPSIDRLDIANNGAVAEYSLKYTITVNECDPRKPITRQIGGAGAKVTPYAAMGLELLEVLNSPLVIKRVPHPVVAGGAGQRHARFELPPLAPGTNNSVTLWIAPGSPLHPPTGLFEINDATDSNQEDIFNFFSFYLSGKIRLLPDFV